MVCCQFCLRDKMFVEQEATNVNVSQTACVQRNKHIYILKYITKRLLKWLVRVLCHWSPIKYLIVEVKIENISCAHTEAGSGSVTPKIPRGKQQRIAFKRNVKNKKRWSLGIITVTQMKKWSGGGESHVFKCVMTYNTFLNFLLLVWILFAVFKFNYPTYTHVYALNKRWFKN